ncbi:prephenate dehydratase PHA2 NDAI_0G01530 [Naumovozyma dairenensis CBS 421]|uniref:prephenate dehydratase n=1 Tax=Naumovozyma dairenensis (strain ATCC 10597 / BCRC 20456 / CBS 421 / NBRC 0211 / NRRL Y-12639) TaxID=1071378 RepID=G0WDR8_NAUDC|nr:hypothetical protein NDAI_0G01530 [Naumovozyma dairenensis CBS 421]CCD25929.2 hypothetical protein NDAI_0G01530 [Naumovozyma dairenensis CBS 421]
MNDGVTKTKLKVLFLGPKGTYSHQAALQHFGHLCDSSIYFVPTRSIPQCFDDLEKDTSVNYSSCPLRVILLMDKWFFSYALLRDQMIQSKNKIHNRIITPLEVVGEQYVSISHCLISPVTFPKGDNLSNYNHVKIYSHPQVWGQVSLYLTDLKAKYRHMKFECIDTTSTSEAVRIALETQNNGTQDSKVLNLAIASQTAANLFNGVIIDNEINDKKGNTTRFLVLQRRDSNKGTRLHKKGMESDNANLNINFTTFTARKDDPGSLVDILMILKSHSLNMCSISSRPCNRGLDGRNWHYIFFIEYYNFSEHIDWEKFHEEFDKHCLEWCLWGSFPRNERYYAHVDKQ